MEDKEIIGLFFSREESAITRTKEKYGSYCAAIAGNILGDHQDVEEVLSDTWLRVWNTIPPKRPEHLKLYLARIARNLAFDRFRADSRAKRGGGEMPLALEELRECLPAPGNPEEVLAARELKKCINAFLWTLPERDREIFLLRYFSVESTVAIAKKFRLSEAGVRTVLSRTRKKLKDHLEKEGYL